MISLRKRVSLTKRVRAPWQWGLICPLYKADMRRRFATAALAV